jgi:hypothetical protein
MKPRYRLEVFRGAPHDRELDARDEQSIGFYWRLRSRRNGKIVAISGEPFASKGNARRAFRALGIAEVEEST